MTIIESSLHPAQLFTVPSCHTLMRSCWYLCDHAAPVYAAALPNSFYGCLSLSSEAAPHRWRKSVSSSC